MNCSQFTQYFVLLAVLCVGLAAAQERSRVLITRPRPYFFTGLDLEGNGSRALNYAIASGIQQERGAFILDAYAQYVNTRKNDDNTINNHSGRTRTLYAVSRYRLQNGWFVGAGSRWSQLSTTNYVKQAFRPFAGGGKDWPSARASVDYLWTLTEHVNRQGCPVPDGQCTNRVQGFDFQLFMPSPRSRSHFLFRMDLTSFWFHTTVTTTDPVLTKRQLGQHSMGSTLSYSMLFRY